MFREANGHCVYCGLKLTLDTVTLDHIYPQQHGGPDEPLNLVATCGRCNGDKANIRPDEWFSMRPTAAGAFLLLAPKADPAWRRVAAAECDTPYREELLCRLPRMMRTRKHLASLSQAVKLLIN